MKSAENRRIRNLSNIVSNKTFNDIIRKGSFDSLRRNLIGNDITHELHRLTNRELLEQIYSKLNKFYRIEYIYKNTITNKILLGRHSLNTTTMLNEFRIEKSIADLVLINGNAVVYEIKTEYDSPSKLKSQLDDYRKVFKYVYLVTHHSLTNKYLSLVEKENTGLIVLTKRNTLKTIKNAEKDDSLLNNAAMMRCLRKHEYSNIIKEHFGEIPNVPNTLFYKRCKALSRSIDPLVMQKHMQKQLKLRNLKEAKLINSAETPMELKHICLCLDLNESEYSVLHTFLKSNFSS